MKITTTRRAPCAALLLLLACSGGCANFAQEVCVREQAIGEAVTEATAYVGPIGDIFGTGIGLALGILCSTVEATCAAVDAGGGLLGVGGESVPEEDPGT